MVDMEQIKAGMLGVLDGLQGLLPQSDLDGARQNVVEHREYGLVLEDLAACADETGTALPPAVADEMARLAAAMGIEISPLHREG